MTARKPAKSGWLVGAASVRMRTVALLLLPVAVAAQAQTSTDMSSMPGMKGMAPAAPASKPTASKGPNSMPPMQGMAAMPGMAMDGAPKPASAPHERSRTHSHAKKKTHATAAATGSPPLNMHGMPMDTTPSNASAAKGDMPTMAGMPAHDQAGVKGPDAMAAMPGMAGMAGMAGMEGMGGAKTLSQHARSSSRSNHSEKPPAQMSGMQMDGMKTPPGSGDASQAGSMNSMPGMAGMPGMTDAAGSKDGAPEQPSSGMGAMGSMGSMGPMDLTAMMKSMQGGSPPIGARDPNAYSDGLPLGPMPGMDMMDDAHHARLLADRVEEFRTHDAHGQAVDAQAWAGGDSNKLWLKLDGERTNRKLGATRSEALWAHSVATYWDTQLGLRHDFGDGPQRTWAAFGVQGIAPYWFDLQATAYVGEKGRSALRLESEYDLLLTQRLILQPDLKVNFYGKADPQRKLGAGLSDVDGGLRLRYEVTRKFAPYLGVVWQHKFGRTATLTRESGESAGDTQIVAGVRLWF
jgi:copper resistance protein B